MFASGWLLIEFEFCINNYLVVVDFIYLPAQHVYSPSLHLILAFEFQSVSSREP